MSASPRLSMASRVDSSGIDLNTSRFTLGVFRQYCSFASTTSSTPGVNETNRYGPAPTGAFLKPSSPTFSTYFRGTRRRRRVEREEVGPRRLELKAHAARVDDLHLADLVLQDLRGHAAVVLE